MVDGQHHRAINGNSSVESRFDVFVSAQSAGSGKETLKMDETSHRFINHQSITGRPALGIHHYHICIHSLIISSAS
jgi:hypothetical protein